MADAMVAHPFDDREARERELADVVDRVLARAERAGADAAAVTASLQAGLSAQVRLGDVETLEHTRDRGVSISVYLGQRKGEATTADFRPEVVDDCVDRALDIARYTEEDPCNGLPEADRLATEFPSLDLWHPQPMDAERIIEQALACEAAGLADDRITNSEGGSVSHALGLTLHGNSLGFRGASGGTRYSQGCVLIAGEGDGMQRDYWFDSRRAVEDLQPLEETGREAARRTVARLGARQLKTGRYPVILSPQMARSLIGHLVGAISGGQLYRDASFLKGCAGEQLFPEWFRISERPYLPRAVASSAFDSEGVATAERELVDDGILTGYVLSSYSARRLGLETTGNAGGVHNLVVADRGRSLDEMVRDMGRGLLVTELIGQGVNLLTGDYSRGAAGFWVEDGEIAHPVEEVTIAGRLKDIFSRVLDVGRDVDTRGNIRTGSIWLDDMTVAGN